MAQEWICVCVPHSLPKIVAWISDNIIQKCFVWNIYIQKHRILKNIVVSRCTRRRKPDRGLMVLKLSKGTISIQGCFLFLALPATLTISFVLKCMLLQSIVNGCYDSDEENMPYSKTFCPSNSWMYATAYWCMFAKSNCSMEFCWYHKSLLNSQKYITKVSCTLSREYRVVRGRYSQLLFTSEDRLCAISRVKEQSTNMTSQCQCLAFAWRHRSAMMTSQYWVKKTVLSDNGKMSDWWLL